MSNFLKIYWNTFDCQRQSSRSLTDYTHRQNGMCSTTPNAFKMDDTWGKVVTKADQRGLIRRGLIGKAECMLFKAKPVVDIYEDLRRINPYKFFGIKK